MAFKFNPFTGNFDDVANVAQKVTGPVSSTDNAIVRFDGTTGKLVQNSLVTIDDSGNVVIAGDLTVNGTTVTINTATLDVEDANITVNVNGNNASAEGAGLTVNRTGTDGSLVYEDALTSKFKIGALGSEVEIATVSGTQTLTNKTINAVNNTITDIADTNISATAAISFSKLASLTADRAVITNSVGVLAVSSVTNTELGYLSGVSSSVQTQLNAKLDDFSSTTDNALVRTNGTSGSALQDSGIIIDDSDNLSGLAGLTFTAGVQVTSILDQDNMSSNSDTALATQQSIKAYVDSEVASASYNVSSISSNTTAVANETYLVDSTGGVVSVTLPTPTSNIFVRIKDSGGDCSTNNITIVRSGSENIDNAASNYILDSNLESKVFVSDGTDWYVL